MKTQILTAIGETDLQPALQLNEALGANDRVKYAFSLLQMALAHSEHPEQPSPTLRQERIACGVVHADFDTAVAGSRMAGQNCEVPCAAKILAGIATDMRIMAAPAIAAQPGAYAARLSTLLEALPRAANDVVDPIAVSAMMRVGHDGADSLHRLVMDLHKELNAMQAALAEETLDGAAASNLAEADRPLILAFMAGVNHTAKLKFTHPGLATTATRSGNRLIIQNDIGMTDAHVIVIHVESLAVAVTYTDVHSERLAFFEDMLSSQKVVWDKSRTDVLAAGSAFYLTTGRLETADTKSCCAYLEFLGSRLVFLIDWNRARKDLRGFLRKADRLSLLSWAAEMEVGHRGFLELGGARLVNQAIEAVAGSSMHFGDRLCDVLGDSPTMEFFHFVFKTAAEGLMAAHSRALIHDRIRVSLAAHFSKEEQQLLAIAADHAGLIFELASLAQDALQADDDNPAKAAIKRGTRAKNFEHDADRKVMDTREALTRRPDYAVFLRILEAADDAADALEDAIALIGLQHLDGQPLDELQNLTGLLVQTAQEWIKALGHATQISPAASDAETGDFLSAIDKIAELEHSADDAQRALTASAVQFAPDFRQLHLFASIGDRLEDAADGLKHASLILHDHVLEDVIDG